MRLLIETNGSFHPSLGDDSPQVCFRSRKRVCTSNKLISALYNKTTISVLCGSAKECEQCQLCEPWRIRKGLIGKSASLQGNNKSLCWCLCSYSFPWGLGSKTHSGPCYPTILSPSRWGAGLCMFLGGGWVDTLVWNRATWGAHSNQATE